MELVNKLKLYCFFFGSPVIVIGTDWWKALLQHCCYNSPDSGLQRANDRFYWNNNRTTLTIEVQWIRRRISTQWQTRRNRPEDVDTRKKRPDRLFGRVISSRKIRFPKIEMRIESVIKENKKTFTRTNFKLERIVPDDWVGERQCVWSSLQTSFVC